VTIGIGHVEEPLAPFGIAGRRIWAIAGRDHSRMEGVNVGAVEDHASPPVPLALGRLRDEIDIAGSHPKARECSVLTAVNDLKSQHAIEADGLRHIVGGERDGADAFDHGGNASLYTFLLRSAARPGARNFFFSHPPAHGLVTSSDPR